MPRPLEQTVLDPARGSGTFLFHAIRRLLSAANEAGLARAEAVALAAERVRGIDVHPVAVIFARVTWLLALGEAVRERPARLIVPVYLGDSMQWNLREAVGGRDVVVRVPEEAPIVIPAGFAENQAAYDTGIAALQDALRVGGEEGLVAALRRHEGVTEADARAMVAPYRRLRALYEAGRDDVWPFVLRNLVRPLWLSRPENRADVVIGNPPWVRYNELAPELRERLRPAPAAVVPMDKTGAVLDSEGAARAGFPRLVAWLRDAEGKWADKARRRADGSLQRTLRDRIDFNRGLSAQHPPAPLRVIYTASGTFLAAVVLQDERAVVEHKAYWAPVETLGEAYYLAAILNADETRRRIEPFQSRGQFGPRDIDKLVWQVLAIPPFDAGNALHRDLAETARDAERLAADVPLSESQGFRAQRAAIRNALAEAGLAATLDHLVEKLLN